MSFSEDYTEFKVNELKELNVHPEQKDASYKVTGADFKDYGPLNTFLMAIVLVPLIFFHLGVLFAPERYHPVEAAPEEPVEAAAAEAAPAVEEQKPAEIKEAGAAPAEKAAPAAETK